MFMKPKFKTGISGKLVAAFLIAFSVTFSLTGFIVYSKVKKEIISSTKKENRNLTHGLATQVKNSLDEAMTVSRTLAQTMETDIRNARSRSRSDVIRTLRYILDSNSNLLGVYVAFEPDAFDGRDNEYKGTKGHDTTGRFIPYVNRLTGGVTLDPLIDYEKEGVGDYYLIPKKTGRESLLEPYLYQGVLLTSLVVPIKDEKGNFMGIAGVDIGLNSLDSMISKIKAFDTGNAYLISNKGAYLSHSNKIMLGYSTLEDVNAKGIRNAFAAGTGLYVKNATENDVRKVEKMESEITREMRETFKKLASEARAGKSGIMSFFNSYTGQSQWTFYEPVLVGATNTPWSLLVNIPPDEALIPLKGIISNFVIVAVGALILITIIVVLIARRLTKPISRTVNVLQDIAQGEGDLTKRIPITSNDEAGDLARWFNTFVEKLAGIIHQVAKSIKEIEAGTGQMAAAIEQQAKSTTEVTSIVARVAEGAQDQSEGVTTAQESITQLSAAIMQIAKGAQEQATSVEKTTGLSIAMVNNVTAAVNLIKDIGAATKTNTEQAARGNGAVRAVIEGMENIKSGVGQALASVSALDEGSRQIGAIIEVINDIADQTNLLALNAAIEAARVGEHGKGFAVVADEVRNLAEKAKSSTNEISDIIKRLSVSINSTIGAVQASGEQVNEGSRLAGEAGKLLQEIEETALDTVHGISGLLTLADKLEERSRAVGQAMTDVAAVAEETSASAQEITAGSHNVVETIEKIARVSQDNASGAEEVASLTEEQSATSEEMAASANSLANSALKLKDLISQFKTE